MWNGIKTPIITQLYPNVFNGSQFSHAPMIIKVDKKNRSFKQNTFEWTLYSIIYLVSESGIIT